MVRFHRINNQYVQFTAEEEAAKDSEISHYAIDEENLKVEAAQKETNKANAKAKLIAGEALTEAEADAILL